MNFQGILSRIKGFFQPQQRELISPIPKDQIIGNQAPATTTLTPQPAVLGAQAQPKVTAEQIQRGWDNYGDGKAPAATMSAVFADVANQYPVLQKHPGLLPAMAMKETSGGKAPNQKNWFNWGVHLDDYNEPDPEKVIRSVARAIGSDDSGSSHYYKKFRETEDIGDLLNVYAPPVENDTGLYHKQLLNWMKMFE